MNTEMENGMLPTLDECMQMTFPQQIVGVSDSHVRTSASPDDKQVFAYMRTGSGEKARDKQECGKEGNCRPEDRLLVFCNFTRETAPLPAEVSEALEAGASRLIDNYPGLPEGQLRPYEALVLRDRKDG